MIFITALALLIGAFLILYRAIRGPTVYDRILAVNALGTKTVILVVLIGSLTSTPSLFIDTSIVYALINYVATIAILKYVEYRSLG